MVVDDVHAVDGWTLCVITLSFLCHNFVFLDGPTKELHANVIKN